MVKEAQGDPLVALAKEAVEEFVKSGRKKAVPASVSAELAQKAGAFVCLKKSGNLRGCIGTIEATQPSIAGEIINNAISAASRDPRFEPVRADELDDLAYSVDVLNEAEPVDSIDELDPKKYGVIVESGHKRGLLLPDLEGVNTVEEQLGIAMQKAGILHSEPISVWRFTVTRHA
ncbi:MAG TPA: AmmeMemoRadiSam system protein A [Armatimonadota bacterium]|jgi:AmmeMemoRadiSam system protein A